MITKSWCALSVYGMRLFGIHNRDFTRGENFIKFHIFVYAHLQWAQVVKSYEGEFPCRPLTHRILV